jgi:excisionase family DNA binding protein
VDAGEKMITTEEAAEILNVSRSYVVKLMSSGALSAVKVGRYRRLSSGEVRRYKDASIKEREAALNELAEISQELGLGY